MGQKVTTKTVDKHVLDMARIKLYLFVLKLIDPKRYIDETKIHENFN